MFSLRAVYAEIVGAIVALVSGFALTGLVLGEYFAEHMTPGLMKEPDEIILWAMILGHIFFSLLIVYIYDVIAGVKDFRKGLIHGIFIGLFMGSIFNLIDYGSLNKMIFIAYILDIAAVTIVASLTGGVVAYVLGRGTKA